MRLSLTCSQSKRFVALKAAEELNKCRKLNTVTSVSLHERKRACIAMTAHLQWLSMPQVYVQAQTNHCCRRPLLISEWIQFMKASPLYSKRSHMGTIPWILTWLHLKQDIPAAVFICFEHFVLPELCIEVWIITCQGHSILEWVGGFVAPLQDVATRVMICKSRFKCRVNSLLCYSISWNFFNLLNSQ